MGEPLHSKKFQKTLILVFEANSALSCENETKILKIAHSASSQYFIILKKVHTNLLLHIFFSFRVLYSLYHLRQAENYCSKNASRSLVMVQLKLLLRVCCTTISSPFSAFFF